MPPAYEPLARAAVSLRLYPHDLAPADVVAELMAQAQLAESSGFDGVMTSEHHGGFPNYVPNPLLAATWALDATDRIWAAPCPMLLPLRPVGQVVEDIAWTAQRFPGRVGAGFAAGALADDFVLSGVPFEEMRTRFRDALPVAVAGLRGDAAGPLAGDPAVAALARSARAHGERGPEPGRGRGGPARSASACCSIRSSRATAPPRSLPPTRKPEARGAVCSSVGCGWDRRRRRPWPRRWTATAGRRRRRPKITGGRGTAS